jgi:hypothetical protein
MRGRRRVRARRPGPWRGALGGAACGRGGRELGGGGAAALQTPRPLSRFVGAAPARRVLCHPPARRDPAAPLSTAGSRAIMREIITLQLGELSCYTGAHFWNIQVRRRRVRSGGPAAPARRSPAPSLRAAARASPAAPRPAPQDEALGRASLPEAEGGGGYASIAEDVLFAWSEDRHVRRGGRGRGPVWGRGACLLGSRAPRAGPALAPHASRHTCPYLPRRPAPTTAGRAAVLPPRPVPRRQRRDRRCAGSWLSQRWWCFA